jgi:hypothetical protein
MQPDTAAARYGLKLNKFIQPAKSNALTIPDHFPVTRFLLLH